MKTILITGGTSGIGYGLAEKYLIQGCRVIITGRSSEKLENVKKKLESYSNLLELKLIDVRDEEEMKNYLLQMDDLYKIDIVIANAGISAGVSDNTNFNDIAKEVFDINVYGVFNTVHPLLERMKQRKKGHIVLISSMSAFFGLTSAVFYASSKAAIKSYGEGLRILMFDYNIDVTTIFPGFVESNITRSNKFKMPFFMDTKSAIDIMVKGIAHKKGYISFPKKMQFLVYVISILPFWLREKILKALPHK